MKITKARLRQIIKEELDSIDVTAERKSDDMEEPIKQATINIIMEIEKLADVIGPFGARRAIVRAIAALKSKQEQYAVNEELEEIRTDGRGFAPSAIATYKDSDDHGEGHMARGQLGRIEELAGMIQNMVQDDSDLEEWVESKITKAQDYLSSVLNYMRGEQLSENELDEILANNSDVGDYIDDFRKSDAPQFKGKSKEKRRQMAIAAALSAKDKKSKR